MNKNMQSIFDAIIEGNINGVAGEVQNALDNGIEATSILDEGLIPAMDEVGRRFEEGSFFVPEMLISARAMQQGLGVLKPLLAETDTASRGKVAIGTVKGDLHDIGKNLVAMMLEGAGYEILDLGTDVEPERFMEAARDGYEILAMSALLTTTMDQMEEVITTAKNKNLRDQVKIIIGGAPVTKEYANQIGADGFAMDASSAVRLVKELQNQN